MPHPIFHCQETLCGRELPYPGRGRPPKWCPDHKKRPRGPFNSDSSTRVCSEVGCDRFVRARGLCKLHYTREQRRLGLEKPQVWTEKRQEYREQRRARMEGAYAGPKAPRFVIAERDRWICGICGQGIPRVVKHGHPLYLTMDHIIPISLGGTHSPENVQAAHARCNYSKGSRVL